MVRIPQSGVFSKWLRFPEFQCLPLCSVSILISPFATFFRQVQITRFFTYQWYFQSDRYYLSCILYAVLTKYMIFESGKLKLGEIISYALEDIFR